MSRNARRLLVLVSGVRARPLVYISRLMERIRASTIAVLLPVLAMLLVLASCGGDATPSPTPPPTERPPLLSLGEHLQRGDAFLEQRLPGAAIREYRNALEVDAQDPLARLGLGKSHAMRAEYDLALDQFRYALRIDPDLAEVYFERGKVYGHQAKLTPAIRDFDKSIDLDPDRAEVYNSRGFALIGQGKPVEAINDFNKAIELDPEYADAYANRAFTYAALGEDEDAESDAERAIELGLNRDEVMDQLEEMRSSR